MTALPAPRHPRSASTTDRGLIDMSTTATFEPGASCLLSASLRGNAAFSAVSGIVLIAAAAPLAALMGIAAPAVLPPCHLCRRALVERAPPRREANRGQDRGFPGSRLGRAERRAAGRGAVAAHARRALDRGCGGRMRGRLRDPSGAGPSRPRPGLTRTGRPSPRREAAAGREVAQHRHRPPFDYRTLASVSSVRRRRIEYGRRRPWRHKST